MRGGRRHGDPPAAGGPPPAAPGALQCPRCQGPAIIWRGKLQCQEFSCWEQEQLALRAAREDLSDAEIERRFEVARRYARVTRHLTIIDIYRRRD